MALILGGVLFVQYLLYVRLGLKNVTYDLTLSVSEAFEGDEIEVVEEIENAKLLPLPWVRTEINCSRWLTFHGQKQDKNNKEQRGLVSGIFVLRGYQKCRRVWRVRCDKRGVFSVSDVSVSVSDLFGLAKPTMVVKIDKKIRVLPSPVELETGVMSAEAFIGDIVVERFVLPDPFVISGAKEYTGREPMNRIHWSQTARTGTLMAYNNEFTTERRVLIVLNMQRGYNLERQQLSVPVLESQIKAAAFILDHCYKSRTEVSLVANSTTGLCTEYGTGYQHTIDVLRSLAELKNGCGKHIDDLFSELSFNGYTDVVLITPFISDKVVEVLAVLQNNGVAISLFSTEIEECGLCEVRHIPRGRYYITESGDDE